MPGTNIKRHAFPSARVIFLIVDRSTTIPLQVARFHSFLKFPSFSYISIYLSANNSVILNTI